eukprot:CAMPEP_0169445716 /NCGR_PEP_ID=MMETSP1042-20121227/10588_1 /TAXON_ID=464988 /ORGANISM="Hemiselmis andersenii, Strain CCMP1180" /LENGTH=141 /DNA_ID=CAMNT_0009557131 /DNA_START=225 /DNA_END=647 /DNA_ORIENTATION=-
MPGSHFSGVSGMEKPDRAGSLHKGLQRSLSGQSLGSRGSITGGGLEDISTAVFENTALIRSQEEACEERYVYGIGLRVDGLRPPYRVRDTSLLRDRKGGGLQLVSVGDVLTHVSDVDVRAEGVRVCPCVVLPVITKCPTDT